MVNRYAETWRVALKGRDKAGFKYTPKERALALLFAKGMTIGAFSAYFLGENYYRSHKLEIYEGSSSLREAFPYSLREGAANIGNFFAEKYNSLEGFVGNQFNRAENFFVNAAHQLAEPSAGMLIGFGLAASVAAYVALHNHRIKHKFEI